MLASGASGIDAVRAAFEALISHLQSLRAEEKQPKNKNQLQRYIERLERARKDLPKLIR